MSDWWKAPVLQGEDNDYGQYDYMIEEIPQDYAKWEFDRKYKWKCDDCGKHRHLSFCTAHYFYTLDSYDSMSWNTCWKCCLKNRIFNIKYHIKFQTKNRIKAFKDARMFYKSSNKAESFMFWYKLARKWQKG